MVLTTGDHLCTRPRFFFLSFFLRFSPFFVVFVLFLLPSLIQCYRKIVVNVEQLVRRVAMGWIEVRFHPCYNPSWLTELETPTDWQ